MEKLLHLVGDLSELMDLHTVQSKRRILQHVGLRAENLTLLRISCERKRYYDASLI